jgi:hypothetical protein
MDDTENTVNRNLRAMLATEEGGGTLDEIGQCLEELALSRWLKPLNRTDPNRGPDMQILQVAATYRLAGAVQSVEGVLDYIQQNELQQGVADLHQIVRLLNERLAKLERG